MANTDLIKKLRDLTQAGVMDAKKALDETNDDIDAAIQWLREKGIAKAAKKESALATEGIANVIVKDNDALILEVNSQTDFVAGNENFMQLVDGISNTLITSKVKTIEEALQTKIANGSTIDYACKEITGRIGEKIALRRFSILSKEKNQTFAHYQHSNKKIAVLLLFNGTINEQLGKDIAMHAAAMAPKFLNEKEVDQEWLNNEKKILTEQTIAEGKPAERAEMIVQGRVNKLLSEVTLVNQQFVKDQSKKINQLLKENNVDLLKYIRYEVGEGIEKQVVDFAAEVAEQMKK